MDGWTGGQAKNTENSNPQDQWKPDVSPLPVPETTLNVAETFRSPFQTNRLTHNSRPGTHVINSQFKPRPHDLTHDSRPGTMISAP